MPETVLVTGGTGYVGGFCIAELLKRGYAVRTTVRSLAKEQALRIWVGASNDERLKVFAADLTADAGWDAAMKGVDYVWHVASPLGIRGSRDPNALIVPARDGALRALRAATAAGVKRIVLTSSTAASGQPPHIDNIVNDETVWTDPKAKGVTAYRQSKVIAERAAWDFMAKNNATAKLATVLPTAIFGPIQTAENMGSVQVISRLLTGKAPGIPRLGFCVVDVRDVVDAHMRAMTTPEAGGQRFIATSEHMWLTAIAKLLREKLGDKAKKVPARQFPDFMVRLAALFDPDLRELTPGLGRKYLFTSAKAQRVLGFKPRPPESTIIDCANSLIEKGAA